jgi:sugar O-acyltransferase (sialic acid O-acetyltransferase NeuD family)
MKKLVLIGGGGHCKSCIDVIEGEGRYEIVGILDRKEKLGSVVLGYKIIGTDAMIAELAGHGIEFLITIGQIGTPNVRRSLYKKLLESKAEIATIISNRAYVSKHAVIEKGSIIMNGALVNAGARIGNNCIINSKALVEHDVTIEGHCHISTAAVINGGATVKEGSFFGSNAVSKEYALTRSEDFIKAGSVFRG